MELTVTIFDRPDTAFASAWADLWVRVNDAGGAVGFLPGAPRADVDRAVLAHLAAVASGERSLVVVRDDGQLVGVAVLKWVRGALLGHTAHVSSVMTDPGRRGEGIGSRLMAEVVTAARDRGVELLTLDYRDGLGIGEFYRSCGWTQTGRTPGKVKLAPDDIRASIAMARRTDGRPLEVWPGPAIPR
jgi:GNAT superfamily N-acetyltransferase